MATGPGGDPECMSAGPEPLLTVAVPVYNERATVLPLLERVLAVPVSLEVVLVDDGSTDGTRELLRERCAQGDPRVRLIEHPVNQGKGAAIVTAIGAARGRFLIVQDADLEYDPGDYPALLAPLLSGEAEVVYGSRFARCRWPEGMRFPNWLANRILTIATNVLFPGARITDEATCYKVFRRDVLGRFALRARRFDFCPEVTAKVLRRGIRIHEVPISYVARTGAQGKKIRWTDALDAFRALVRYRLRD
ncbi:MAG: glycosyltransferase family 2 protein [Armatimonadota bacterium]